MTAPRRVALVAGLLLVVLAVPALVVAHPLGNFTINHYAGIRVTQTSIALDVVIDQAEIPAFAERQRIDADRDGTVSAAEAEAERVTACGRLADDLRLEVGGVAQRLSPVAAGLSFPAGTGGLPTLRLVCGYEIALAAPLAAGSSITFSDGSWASRIGWREVVVVGDGVTVDGGADGLPETSISDRLTAYPESLLSTPPAVRTVTFTAVGSGPAAAPFRAPDAQPLAPMAAPSVDAVSDTRSDAVSDAAGAAAIPGGVGGEIAGLLRTQDLTPLVLLASLLAAALLGAGHALTPGHGKTIMAAYLVGSRGSTRHAVGLGLATAVSHTIGVVVLGAGILVAGSALPAERVLPVLSLVSAVLVVAIGAWMTARQWPVMVAYARRGLQPVRVSAGPPGHDHDHGHSHHSAHDHGHEHPHPHPHPHPIPGRVGWRTLFALGLSGGLVPSTSALLILVATVATGRPAFGLVLVAAFGLGMAAVLVSLGIALSIAGDRLNRLGGRRPWLSGALTFAPVGGALAVLGLGIVLTAQALGGGAVL